MSSVPISKAYISKLSKMERNSPKRSYPPIEREQKKNHYKHGGQTLSIQGKLAHFLNECKISVVPDTESVCVFIEKKTWCRFEGNSASHKCFGYSWLIWLILTSDNYHIITNGLLLPLKGAGHLVFDTLHGWMLRLPFRKHHLVVCCKTANWNIHTCLFQFTFINKYYT